jgi:hypothetical protein
MANTDARMSEVAAQGWTPEARAARETARLDQAVSLVIRSATVMATPVKAAVAAAMTAQEATTGE